MEEKSYKEYLNHITTFIFDVDGVLTDGTILLTTNGDLLRTMHIKDGFAAQYLMKKGYPIAIVTGGVSESVRERFKRIGINTYKNI